MSAVLITIHKQDAGHKWSNTHAAYVGATPSGIPTDADLVSIGADQLLTEANTNASPTNLIQRLVAFERTMHAADVQFTDVYVTDGKRGKFNPAGTVYATLSMNVPGIRSASGSGGAPYGGLLSVGGVTLMVHRSGVGFSLKPGRMYIRGCLLDTEVEIVGGRMIGFSAGALTTLTALLGTAVAKGLNTHFFGGTNIAGGVYGIPRYVNKVQAVPPLYVGELQSVFPISGLSVVGPVLRQVQRGRRHKTVAPAFG